MKESIIAIAILAAVFFTGFYLGYRGGVEAGVEAAKGGKWDCAFAVGFMLCDRRENNG